MHKILNLKTKSIEFMDKEQIEKCLTSVMKDVTLFTRGYKFATIEVRFSSAEKAREVSNKTLKTEEMKFLPTWGVVRPA